jgi:hypothetical protein
MKAGLLFYLSRRTSSCQRVLRRSAGYFGLEVPEARFCVKKEALGGALARLLRQYPMVFVVGSAQGKRPDCAGPIFNMLHVPPGPDGEPRGIMRLPGAEKTGYLVESATQAIILLPDDPYEILKMAKPMFQRLKRKFSLTGDFSKVEHPDYAKLIADCMEKAEHT